MCTRSETGLCCVPVPVHCVHMGLDGGKGENGYNVYQGVSGTYRLLLPHLAMTGDGAGAKIRRKSRAGNKIILVPQHCS